MNNFFCRFSCQFPIYSIFLQKIMSDIFLYHYIYGHKLNNQTSSMDQAFRLAATVDRNSQG